MATVEGGISNGTGDDVKLTFNDPSAFYVKPGEAVHSTLAGSHPVLPPAVSVFTPRQMTENSRTFSMAKLPFHPTASDSGQLHCTASSLSNAHTTKRREKDGGRPSSSTSVAARPAQRKVTVVQQRDALLLNEHDTTPPVPDTTHALYPGTSRASTNYFRGFSKPSAGSTAKVLSGGNPKSAATSPLPPRRHPKASAPPAATTNGGLHHPPGAAQHTTTPSQQRQSVATGNRRGLTDTAPSPLLSERPSSAPAKRLNTLTVATNRPLSSITPTAVQGRRVSRDRTHPTSTPKIMKAVALRVYTGKTGDKTSSRPASAGDAGIKMTDLTKPMEAYKVLRSAHSRELPPRAHVSIQKRMVANLFLTKYPLLRLIAAEKGFDIEETEEALNEYQFNLCWSDTVLPLTRLTRLGNWQRTNHFPSMHLLCRKVHLATTLGHLHRVFPTYFNFYPHTWSLRSERAQFVRYYMALKTKRLVKFFIVKPNSGCQGRGIIVTRDPLSELDEPEKYIVQEYISRPLLMENRKFDLRVYVLLTSIRDPSVFVFNDGLVRICTEVYEKPNDINVKNACKHLTNYAVNKNNSEYVFNTDAEDGGVGHKRNFRFFNNWLEMQGRPAKNFWDRVGFIIVKSILAAQPQITSVYNSCFPRLNDGYSCFEVLGFDILVDSKMRPWLMEVNHTPSFATDTPLDMDIKSKLISEVWDIVDCKTTDQENDRLRERAEFTRRNMPPWATPNLSLAASIRSASTNDNGTGLPVDGASAPPSKEITPSYLSERRRNEDSKLRNFWRAYPSENPEIQNVYDLISQEARHQCVLGTSTYVASAAVSSPAGMPVSTYVSLSERQRREPKTTTSTSLKGTTPRSGGRSSRSRTINPRTAAVNPSGALPSPSRTSTTSLPPNSKADNFKKLEGDILRYRHLENSGFSRSLRHAKEPNAGEADSTTHTSKPEEATSVVSASDSAYAAVCDGLKDGDVVAVEEAPVSVYGTEPASQVQDATPSSLTELVTHASEQQAKTCPTIKTIDIQKYCGQEPAAKLGETSALSPLLKEAGHPIIIKSRKPSEHSPTSISGEPAARRSKRSSLSPPQPTEEELVRLAVLQEKLDKEAEMDPPPSGGDNNESFDFDE